MQDIFLSNTKNLHKWGYSDTYFEIKNTKTYLTGNKYAVCNYHITNLIEFISKELEIKDLDIKDIQKEIRYNIKKSKINQHFLDSIYGIEYSLKSDIRLQHSYGQTFSSEIYTVLYGGNTLNKEVDLVVYPINEEEITRLISSAYENNVCLIPYGGGTNNYKALSLSNDENRMLVSVDMSKINDLISIDKENNLATFGAGIKGKDLEKLLGEKGYTCGHLPENIDLSTLGGWISTNSSGIKRNKYGNIDDIVVNYKLHTTEGNIEKITNTPHNSVFSGLSSIVFGSEGNYGIISQATIKINKKPESIEYQSIIFENFEKGIQFMKEITINNSNIIPTSIRLIDNKQLRFASSLQSVKNSLKSVQEYIKDILLKNYYYFNPNEMVLCKIIYEGTNQEIYHKKSLITKLAIQYGGIEGDNEIGEKCYQMSFVLPYMRDFLSKFYIICDSFETSVPWSNIRDVCKDVELKLYESTKNQNSKPFISYCITQTYTTGVCICFMLGLHHKDIDNIQQIFSNLQYSLKKVILDNGGSISQQGIGKKNAKLFLKSYNSNIQIKCLQNFKKTVDPKNIFSIKNNIFYNDNKILNEFQKYNLDNIESNDDEYIESDSDSLSSLESNQGKYLISDKNEGDEEQEFTPENSDDEKIIDKDMELNLDI